MPRDKNTSQNALDVTARIWVWIASHEPFDLWLSLAQKHLDPIERAQWQNHLEKHQHQRASAFALTRLLRRLQLAHVTHKPPQHFTIGSSPQGQPCLQNSVGRAVTLSQAHAQQGSACAVGFINALGVDLERRDRMAHTPEKVDVLAKRLCSSGEINQINAFAPNRRARCWMALWVLKEATAKALGEGVLASFRRSSMDVARLAAFVDQAHEVGDHLTTQSPWMNFSDPLAPQLACKLIQLPCDNIVYYLGLAALQTSPCPNVEFTWPTPQSLKSLGF